MSTGELLPILSGLLLGCLIGYAPGRLRSWGLGCIVLTLAACATVTSGEFRESWGYLFVDLLIVVASATGVYLAITALRQKPHRHRGR